MAEVELKIEPKLFDDNKAGFNIDAEQVNFTGLITSNIPLDTAAKDVVSAINELKKELDEGGGEWQPPADWIPVPEPAENEAYFLINTNDDVQISITAYGKTDETGTFVIDWGDGTTTDGDSEGTYTHTYATQGTQFLIKISVSPTGWEYFSLTFGNVLIAKYGLLFPMKIVNGYLDWTYGGNFQRNVIFMIKMPNVPTGATGISVASCSNLRKLVYQDTTLLQKIKLQGCKSLNISISSEFITTIDGSAFMECYSLKSINCPNCTSVESYAFQYCLNLSSATFASNCTFGSDVFYWTPLLYPKPQ